MEFTAAVFRSDFVVAVMTHRQIQQLADSFGSKMLLYLSGGYWI